MVNIFCTLRPIVLASQSPRRQRFLEDLGIEYFLYHDLLLENQENALTPFTDRIACSCNPLVCGVRAKDDTEERPYSEELPEDYVLRAAFGKVLDAIQNLSSINEKMSMDVGNNVQGLLDVEKKETLNLSYSVEKYFFKSNIFCHAQYSSRGVTTKSPHGINKEELKNSLVITADTIVALDNEILGKPYDEADALSMLRRMVGREHRVLTTVCVADLEAKCVYSFTDIAYVHFAPWSIELLESYIKTGDSMDKAGSYGIQGVGMFLSDGIQGSWDTVAGLPVAKLLELLLYCKAIKV